MTRISSSALTLLALIASCGEATAPPGPPAVIQLLSSSRITATVGDTIAAPITVQVRDSAGHPVPNVPLFAFGVIGRPSNDGRTYSVVAIDSIVSSDANGRATFRLIAPTVADSGIVSIVMAQGTVGPAGVGDAEVRVVTTAAGFAQLIPHRAQRFSGATFSVDSLFTPTDRYGNVVSRPAETVTVTNGWTASGNTVVPPSASYAGAALVTATSGSVTASDSVSVVEDLRNYHWTFQYKCASTPAQVAAGAPDSVITYGTNGSAYYPGDPGYQPIITSANATQPVLEFRFSGNFTSYRNGVATVDAGIMAGNPYGWEVYAQRPDAVVFGVDTYARTLTRAAGALPSFVSSTAWCSGTTLQGVTLQAY